MTTSSISLVSALYMKICRVEKRAESIVIAGIQNLRILPSMLLDTVEEIKE